MMMKTATAARSAELRSSRRGRGDLAPASLGAADLITYCMPNSCIHNLGPPASTPPPFHCLGKHSLCNIISFSSTFKIQEILFSLQTCTFLKKRRFSEDVVFQKSTSRQHGSTRFRIRRLPEATHDKPTTYRSLRSPCSWLYTGAWPS